MKTLVFSAFLLALALLFKSIFGESMSLFAAVVDVGSIVGGFNVGLALALVLKVRDKGRDLPESGNVPEMPTSERAVAVESEDVDPESARAISSAHGGKRR